MPRETGISWGLKVQGQELRRIKAKRKKENVGKGKMCSEGQTVDIYFLRSHRIHDACMKILLSWLQEEECEKDINNKSNNTLIPGIPYVFSRPLCSPRHFHNVHDAY